MDFSILAASGIDTDTALKRYMGKGELYARLLEKFLSEPNDERLVKAVSEQNKSEALSASHSLKGICGNLSLTRLFALFSEQVRLFREDEWEAAVGLMPEITENYESVTAAVSQWLETIR